MSNAMKKKSAKIEEKKGVFYYNPVFRNLTGDKELTNQGEVPFEEPSHRRAVADDVIGFALNQPHRRCGLEYSGGDPWINTQAENT